MEDTVYSMEPDMMALSYGGCMALTPKSSPLRIGVIGTDANEARMLFQESLKRWKEINETEKGSAKGERQEAVENANTR